MPVDIGAFSINTKTFVLCYLLFVVELGVIDKTGMGVGLMEAGLVEVGLVEVALVEAGLVEAGISILAVTAHLDM